MRALALVLSTLCLSGCVGLGPTSAASGPDRIDGAAIALNGCVAIQAAESTLDPRLADSVEEGLARHVAYKLGRPVGAAEVRSAARRDRLHVHAEAVAVAAALGCEAVLNWRVVSARADYLVVWAARHLTLEVALVRASDGYVLWTAAHSVSRHDGGLPLTPLSAAFGAAQATLNRASAQDLPSMVDDVLRPMFATLPPRS